MLQHSDGFINNINELTCLIEQDFEHFSKIFDHIISHVVKNSQQTTAFVSFINSQLSNASTRRKGLTLLSSFIPLCPVDVATEYAIAWINNSLKYCENEKEINNISFNTIRPLLDLCSKTPELNKTIASSILEKTVDEIKKIRYDATNSAAALDCLLTCLRVYSGACGPRKIPLEKYILTYLDSFMPSSSIRKAGKCYNSLHQVGGGGTEGINHLNNWMKNQQRLVATIHVLMNQMFEYVTEFGDYEQDIKDILPIEMPPLQESKNYEKIAYRIINTTIFLEEMLIGAFPVKKSIRPEIILNLISRGLSVTPSTLGTHVFEDSINLSSCLCLIQKNLLQLLQCLIVSIDVNLIPWGILICKLILNTLKNISTEDAFVIQSVCDLRLTAYETLQLWLTTAKGASSANKIIDVLFPIIQNDLTPVKNELTLMVQNDGLSNLNKKARKKLMQQQTENFATKMQTSLINKFVNNHCNFQPVLCVSSLQTIQMIISYIGIFVTPKFHKEMQEMVIRTLCNIHCNIISYPYNNESCQIELYKTLIKLTTNYHHKVPPPVQYAVQLLSHGQSSSNPRISEVCSNGLSILNSMVHPLFISLQLPLDIDDLKEVLNIAKTKSIINLEMDITENEDQNEIAVNQASIPNMSSQTSISDVKVALFSAESSEKDDIQKENAKNQLSDAYSQTDSSNINSSLNLMDIEKDQCNSNITIPEKHLKDADKETVIEAEKTVATNENMEVEAGESNELNSIIENFAAKSPSQEDDSMDSLKIDENSPVKEDTQTEIEKISQKQTEASESNNAALDEEEICNSFVDVVNDEV